MWTASGLNISYLQPRLHFIWDGFVKLQRHVRKGILGSSPFAGTVACLGNIRELLNETFLFGWGHPWNQIWNHFMKRCLESNLAMPKMWHKLMAYLLPQSRLPCCITTKSLQRTVKASNSKAGPRTSNPYWCLHYVRVYLIENTQMLHKTIGLLVWLIEEESIQYPFIDVLIVNQIFFGFSLWQSNWIRVQIWWWV